MLRGLPLNRREFKTCYDLDVIKMAVMGAELIGVLLCVVYGKEFPEAPLSQPTAPIAFVRFNIYACYTSGVVTLPIAYGGRAGWRYAVGRSDPLLPHPWTILAG